MTDTADNYKLPNDVRIVKGILSDQEADVLRSNTSENPVAKGIYTRIGATPTKGEVALVVDETAGYRTADLINLDPNDTGTIIKQGGSLARSANLPTAGRILEMRAAEDASRITEAVEQGKVPNAWDRPEGPGSR